MNVTTNNSRIKPVLLFIAILLGSAEAADAQIRTIPRDSLSSKYSYLKFSVVPFFYSAIVNDALWLTFHYEFRTSRNRRITYNAVVDYHNWTYKLIVNGIPTTVIPGNVEFYFRPQIRFYFGPNAFKGVHVGLFPLYLFRDVPSYQIKGSYLGLGAIGGYQLMIRHKIPIEFNIWVAQQTGIVNKVDSQGNPYKGRDSFARGSFELNIGLPIKKWKQ